ncbi:hypothetical protein [Aureimonas sp. AU40]|uniref:hypothetical protein n=1 Tax=Aureimonas sp. AU40 TaxID=1637747 RepID=UPI000782A065|nr:hypothetical protein [Aureimonas sp. AU40]
MQGQTKFPAGFGCDPTLLSGGELKLGRTNGRADLASLGAAFPVSATRPLRSHRPLPSRLAEIESQQPQVNYGRSMSALWPSAALGIALASSLYFLNYF